MSQPFTFTATSEDPLGVLVSTAPVVEGARHVRIDHAAVEMFARNHPRSAPAPAPEEHLHCTFLPQRQFCNYLLALEALNFCFWDAEPRWRVDYQGKKHDGYWALAAALHRAIREDGAPICDPHWLARLELSQLRHLLRGEGRPPPLLDARQMHLREVGRVLVARWEGSFANLVAACGGDAALLAAMVAGEFSSFRDVADWGGRAVTFHKRAQICAADLARLLPEGELQRPAALEKLTAFADYKVPQVLRKEGVLVFERPLAETVQRGESLAAGSAEEVEIRAATIWACEWIARALQQRAPTDENRVTAADVDYLLWTAGQDKTGLPPYHRTRTVYY